MEKERLNSWVNAHQVARNECDDPNARRQLLHVPDAWRNYFPLFSISSVLHFPQLRVEGPNDVYISRSIPVEINHPEGCRNEEQSRRRVLCDLVDVVEMLE